MSKKQVSEMSVFEEARWYALMESIDIIETGCKRHKKDFDKMKLSPIDIEKYINSTYSLFAQKIEQETPGRKMIIDNMDPNLPSSESLETPDTFTEQDDYVEPNEDVEIVDDTSQYIERD